MISVLIFLLAAAIIAGLVTWAFRIWTTDVQAESHDYGTYTCPACGSVAVRGERCEETCIPTIYRRYQE